MSLGHDDTMQGLGCGRGSQCAGSPRYQWVQGVDGLGNTVGYWKPTRPMASAAPYARNTAPFFGEVAESADGHLYQWVQGVDGLGSPFGFWKRLKRLAKRAMPLVQKLAPFVPGGAAALTMATPFLKQAGVAGLGEVGALYAAPDGSLYQLQGVDAADHIDGFADDELRGLADDELNGLADDELHGLSADELNGFADDELRGLSDDELRGLEADDELRGFAANEDLNGFADASEFNGISADADLSGFAAMEPLDGIDADDLNGFAASDDLNGFAADELNGLADDDLRGVSDDGTMNGYVRDGGGINGIEGYRRDGPQRTPAFSPAANAPMWAPLW